MSYPDPPPPGSGPYPGGPPPPPGPGRGYPPGPGQGYPPGPGQGYPPGPGQGYPPGPGYPYQGPPPDRGTDGFAIAALVFGVIGGVLLAVIFAIVALVRINKSGRKGKGLAIAALVLSAVWLAGIVAFVAVAASGDADRDESGVIVDSGDVSAFDVNVGDCWNQVPDATEIASVDAVPCSEPHESEVYAVFDIDLGSDDWPGEDTVIAEAEAGCVARFEEFVGLAYDQSQLEIFYFHPTEESWNVRDDRETACSVIDPAGPSTGTLAGAGR